jgi:Na+-transporting methylmalonyl-CoA/oxaloacetate decarboxylase gamma subunit
MTTAQTEALTGMAVVLVVLALLILPSLFGIARDRRIDREIRAAERVKEAGPARVSSSGRPVPAEKGRAEGEPACV